VADRNGEESMDFDRWSDKDVRQMFARIDQMKVHAPGSTLFDQLEFCENIDAVFERIKVSENARELLLEAWLLIDYIVTYLLRDALHIPECIDNELRLIPFQFDKKIDMIKKLRDIEGQKLPNQKSYLAFELHPDFHGELIEDKEFYEKFLKLACRFEEKKCPKEALVFTRYDFERSRFVSEWWYRQVSALDNEWFQSCKQLNKARNLAAHKLKMTNQEAFKQFGVSCLADLKSILRETIEHIIFRERT
jgi:hypothetical protein